MKKMIIPVAALSLLAVSVNVALAGEVDIPNVFTSGEKAVAADVNANFAAIETAVDDNAVKIVESTTRLDATDLIVTQNSAAVATTDGKVLTNEEAITSLDTDLTAAETAITDHEERIVSLESGNTNDCPSDAGEMVKVGPICVDKYEASVWSAITEGTQYGVGVDDYICTDNGNNCSSNTEASALFARSDAGVMPSASITWFQAAQACTNVGKRLLTNAEWQVAAAGTLDEVGVNCNTNTGSAANTGASNECVSNWGTVDMVGNVLEWVADWVPGSVTSTGVGTNSNGYGNDVVILINSGLNGDNAFPVAPLRGGGYGANTGAGVFAYSGSAQPSFIGPHIGFRCAL